MYTKLFKDEKSCGRRVEEAQRQYATAQKSLQRFLQRAFYISLYFTLCFCFSNCGSYFYWPFNSYNFRNSNTRKCMGFVFIYLSNCSSQPSMVHWLSSSIFPSSAFVCSSRFGDIRPNLHYFQYVQA